MVIQANQLTETDIDTILICQMTSVLRSVSVRRVTVLPTPENGLLKPSQIMSDKIFATKRDKCGNVIGTLDTATMDTLNDALMFVVGLMG